MDVEHRIETPKRFDAFPVIIEYDREAPVIIHPALKADAQKSSGLLKILPPLLEHYCPEKPDDYHTKHIRYYDALIAGIDPDPSVNSWMKETFSYVIEKPRCWDLIYHVKEILTYSNLSPQSAYALKQTCLQIAHGKYVDRTDERLCYNPKREKINQNILIAELPDILQKVLKDCSEYTVHKFIKPLFHNNHLKNTHQKYDLSSDIRSVVNNSDSFVLSPQSSVRIAQEYHALVNDGIQPPHHPFSHDEELSNMMLIGNLFPQKLNAGSHNLLSYHYKKLAFIAYALQNPEQKTVLIDYLHHDLEWHLGYHITYILSGDVYKIDVKTAYKKTMDEFIAIFSAPEKATASVPCTAPTSLLDTYYEQLKKRMCATDTATKNKLLQTLQNTYTELTNKSSFASMTLDAINNHFQEKLPSCPICFELFSDQFTPDAESTVGHLHILKKCKHSLCFTCFKELRTQSCPLCRAQF